MNRLVLLLFTVLLAAAVYFSTERILFCDASYIMLRIINSEWFQIQEYRYGAAVTQAFPFIGVKLNLPISWIIVLYSASFNIFYLAVAAWLVKSGETAMALLMSFFFLLLVSDTFFWTNNEIHQAVAWMFLFFSCSFLMARKKVSPAIFLPVFTFLAFLTLYTHPLIIFSFCFLWFFFMMQKAIWPFSKKRTLIFSIILLVILGARFWVSLYYSKYGYDAAKMQATIHFSRNELLQVFNSPMAREFSRRCLTNYWIMPILFAAGIYSGIRQKQYRPVLLSVGFALVYFVVMCLSFTDFITYYSESEWMSFAIIVTAPFVYFTLPRLKPGIAVYLVAGIFLVRLGYIGAASGKFVERKEWIYSTLDTMRQKKLNKGIIYENDTTRHILLQNNWSQPSESMIASALHDDNPTLTFVVDSRHNINKRMPQRNQMILDFETGYYEKMNTRYFRFDTTSSYQLIHSVLPEAIETSEVLK